MCAGGQTLTSVFTGHFVELWLVLCLYASCILVGYCFVSLFFGRTLAYDTRFYRLDPPAVTQVSEKPLTKTSKIHPLASSFCHPPLDC